MRPMENIEYSRIVDEINRLSGKRVDNIYSSEGIVMLKIGRERIVCQPGIRMNIAKYIPNVGIDAFAQKARKELKGLIFRKCWKHNNDRTIVFMFDGREERRVVFEMFGKGNCILLNRDGRILFPLKRESWKGREIKQGSEYVYPPSNLKESVRECIEDKYIIVCLLKLPLGKKYVKEMLERCGIEERKNAVELTADEIEKLELEYEKIKGSKEAYLFLENGKPKDYGIVEFRGMEIKKMETLSEAIDECFKAEGTAGGASKSEEKKRKIMRRIEELKKREKELKEKEKKYRSIAEYIYEHYDEIERFIREKRKSSRGKIKYEK